MISLKMDMELWLRIPQSNGVMISKRSKYFARWEHDAVREKRGSCSRLHQCLGSKVGIQAFQTFSISLAWE